jgi:protein transport protein SEC24
VSPPPTHTTTKRRQYAAGQTQAYYGTADGIASFEGGYGGGAPQQQQAQVQGQLFTPGLAGDQMFAGQQQPAYYSPEADYNTSPGYVQQQQGAVYGQQQQVSPGQAPQISALTDQFGQMGMGVQKPLQLHTINLLTSPPDPRELSVLPPEIRLPPNACVTPSTTANADPSYLRCTLNAIPTTSNLLSKSKIPLGLVITPYRSLNEGESAVPLVTDTIIARCRRCRTYINPFVQFIDAGNRCVHFFDVMYFRK